MLNRRAPSIRQAINVSKYNEMPLDASGCLIEAQPPYAMPDEAAVIALTFMASSARGSLISIEEMPVMTTCFFWAARLWRLASWLYDVYTIIIFLDLYQVAGGVLMTRPS